MIELIKSFIKIKKGKKIKEYKGCSGLCRILMRKHKSLFFQLIEVKRTYILYIVNEGEAYSNSRFILY